MIRFGKVVATDPLKARVRVQIDDADNVVTFWLPVMTTKAQDDKFYHLPDIGELVVCAFYEDNWDTGVVLGAVYNDSDAVPVANKDKVHIKFKDGTTIEYDRASHKLTADVKGSIEIKSAQRCDIDCKDQIYIKSTSNITIQAPSLSMKGGSPANGVFEGTFVLIGNLEVNGNIHATGTIIDDSGNTNHHSH